MDELLTSIEEIDELKNKHENPKFIPGDMGSEIKELIRMIRSHHISILNLKERVRLIEEVLGIREPTL